MTSDQVAATLVLIPEVVELENGDIVSATLERRSAGPCFVRPWGAEPQRCTIRRPR